MSDHLNATDANMFENESKTIDVEYSDEDQMRHAEYKPLESRLLTFANWPESTEQNPKNLAEAGFFYTGDGDVVRCFHCNMKVWNWKPNDVPWEEHIDMNNPCKFAQETLGYDRMNAIKRSLQAKAEKAARSSLKSLGHPESSVNKALETIQGAGALNESAIAMAADNLRNHGASLGSGCADGHICISCQIAGRQIMFIPCRHTVACASCAEKTHECFQCHKTIIRTQTVFLS